MLQAKVILKSYHFLVILPYYSIISPLAIIDICCICTGKGLYNACYYVALPDSMFYNVGGLKLTMVGVFLPQKMATAVSMSFVPPERQSLNIYQHTPGIFL